MDKDLNAQMSRATLTSMWQFFYTLVTILRVCRASLLCVSTLDITNNQEDKSSWPDGYSKQLFVSCCC